VRGYRHPVIGTPLFGHGAKLLKNYAPAPAYQLANGLLFGKTFGWMVEPFPSPVELSNREKVLRVRVLEYLSQHPQAMDTLDGIAEWWVPLQNESIDRVELRNVLRSLTAEGLVEELHSGSSTRFSLRKLAMKRVTEM
jgi:hypothetical protein